MLHLLVDVGSSSKLTNPSKLNTSTRIESGSEIAPCITPGQVIWIHGQWERVMTGWETMMLSGFPITRVQGLESCCQDSAALRDAAAREHCLVVRLALVQSAMYALSWRRGHDFHSGMATSKADVDAAVALFDSMINQ